MDASRFRVVINTSTVPVGCGNLVEMLVRDGIAETRPTEMGSIRFGVASNPELLREGLHVCGLPLSRSDCGRRIRPGDDGGDAGSCTRR